MSDWLAIVLGVALLALVFSDRGNISAAWRRPSRWYTRDTSEYLRSREPSQPLNVIVGAVLGFSALSYGLFSLLT